jgi:phage major head subunit gpT-like protein
MKLNFKSLFQTRAKPEDALNYRQFSIRLSKDGTPKTLDSETRSVEVVLATEEPAEVFDYNRWEVVREILMMDGVQFSKSKQVPLLDAHQRGSAGSVLGSIRNLQVKDGQLIGKAFMSEVEEAQSPWTKIKEGHLTDISVGYRIIGEPVWIPEGETVKVKGREFTGPVSVVTSWRAKEGSIVPIGADELATVREDIDSKPIKTKEGLKVDPKFRKFLEGKGLAVDATEDEAWAFADRMEVSEPVPEDGKKGEIDIDKLRAAVKEEMLEWFDETRAVCEEYDLMDEFPEFIRAETPIEKVRERALKVLQKRIEEAENVGHRGPAEITGDEKDKFRAAATDSVLLRSDSVYHPEKAAPGADDLRGYNLRELARHALRVAGKSDKGDAMQMTGRALETSDLPYILANVANKALFTGFDTAPETWSTWCATGSVVDFKTNYSPRASETDDLEEVPEHGEYKHGKIIEAQESYSIATYGKLFAITRQAIINDDLGALTNIPAKHGQAAARKVGDVAYAVLTANAAMGDAVALFHADHSNFVDNGSGAVPGVATIAAGILAMGTQKDLQGLRRLNIRPEYFLGPKALEGTTEVFFRSERFVDSDTVATDSSLAATRVNPYSGNYFTRVYEPRLDDDDAAAWYLAGAKGMTVTVFFLNGNQTPYLETRSGWSVDGTEYKVRIDVGAKAMDWKALYFNDGN